MIVKSNRALILLNGLGLFFVVLIPFPTALMGEYPYQYMSSVTYGAVLTLLGTSTIILYSYANKNKLFHESIPQEVVDKRFRRLFIGPIGYILGVVCAFIFLPASYIIYTLIAIYFIFPLPSIKK